jgi:hypothetical protein
MSQTKELLQFIVNENKKDYKKVLEVLRNIELRDRLVFTTINSPYRELDERRDLRHFMNEAEKEAKICHYIECIEKLISY